MMTPRKEGLLLLRRMGAIIATPCALRDGDPGGGPQKLEPTHSLSLASLGALIWLAQMSRTLDLGCG